MMADAGGAPVCGDVTVRLGARPREDRLQIEAGDVIPNQEGMSVNAKVSEMPPFRMPKSIRTDANIQRNQAYDGARGPGELFALQGVAYGPIAIGEDLELVPGHGAHGVIAPARRMPMGDYQTALCDTRPRWIVEEPDGS